MANDPKKPTPTMSPERAAAESKAKQMFGEQTEATKEQTEAQEELNKEFKLTEGHMESVAKAAKELGVVAAKSAEQIAIEQAKLTQALVQTKVAMGDLTQEEADHAAEVAKLQGHIENLALLYKNGKGSAEELKRATAQLTMMQKRGGVAMESYATNLRSSTTSMIEAATGIKTTGNAFTGFIQQMGQGTKSGEIFRKTFMGVEGLTMGANLAFGVAAGTMSKFAEATGMAIKTGEGLLETLGRDTGIATTRDAVYAIEEMASSTSNASISFASLGKTIGEMQIATKGLFGNLAEGNMEIAMFGEEMRSVGVSVGSTGELFAKFGKILGTSGGSIEQIKTLGKDVTKLAKGFHMSADSMMRDVAAMADSLAAFGKNAPEMALGIAEISAATKIGTDTIINFGKSFEFMPDAIQKANDLNLILGAQVIVGQKVWKMMNDGAEGPGKAWAYTMTEVGKHIDEDFLQSVPKMRAFAEQFDLSGTAAARLGEQLAKANETGQGFDELVAKAKEHHQANEQSLQSTKTLNDNIAKFQEKFAIAMSPVTDILAGITGALAEMDATAAKAIGVGLVVGFTALGWWLTKTIRDMTRLTSTIVTGMLKAKIATDQETQSLAKMNATAASGGKTGMFGGKMGAAGMKGAGIVGGVGVLASMGAGMMDDDNPAKKAVGGLGTVASMAGTGAMLGSIIPGVGNIAGGIAGGLAGLVMTMMDDGVLVSKGGKVTATKINNRDDVDVIAKKPGGPLSNAGGFLSGAGSGVGGAMAGAMAGAMLGPLGMLIGAGLGAGLPALLGGSGKKKVAGKDSVEIVVNLFGKEIVRQIVDLIEEEQSDRTDLAKARGPG